ncbi:hypothetical protein FACS189442_1200 [Spirochaetia bacterium]|nr:hypothetical protein FACS189442_1200 [Spirochaetia bacterium]
MPIGYIVGTNNDTLGMGGTSMKTDVLNGLNIAGDVMTGVEIAHIVKCSLLVGLFTGSVQYAQDAAKAADLCYNIEREINAVMGSSEHDGFVAKESQYYPKAVHNNVIAGKNGDRSEFTFYHDKIMGEEEVISEYKRMMKEAKNKRVRN